MIRLLVLFVIILLVALNFSCTFSKIVYYNLSDIDDYEIFPYRELKASEEPFQYLPASDVVRVPERINFSDQKDVPLIEILESSETIAFLIIKNDTLMYETYFDNYSDSSLSYSFSMAKSFTSILIGCAIDEDLIQSEYQPVTDFVPELKQNGFEDVQLKHLLQMTSGMDYAEPGFPTGLHSHFYYGDNLEERCLQLELDQKPGTRFIYKSGENQLLGLILSRVLYPRTISEYMQEKLWDPLGMESDGIWTIDSEENGLEKTFCCIASNARDFSKLGRLYLNKGNWNGKQIISKEWVNKSTQVDSTDGSSWYYQYQWWIASKNSGAFYALGHLGQMMYIDPRNDLIIVRLGKGFDLDKDEWLEIFDFISTAFAQN